MPKSKYDRFFAVIQKDDLIYGCPHPYCEFRFVRVDGNSPAPLRNHLKKSHPVDFARLEEMEKKEKLEKGNSGKSDKEHQQPSTAANTPEVIAVLTVEKEKRAKKSDAARPTNPDAAVPPQSFQQVQPVVHQPPPARSLVQQPQPWVRSLSPVESNFSLGKRSSNVPKSLFLDSSFSVGPEVRLFTQNVAERLEKLPIKKRRTVELLMVQLLNDAENKEDKQASVLQSTLDVAPVVVEQQTELVVEKVEEFHDTH